jgi:hypothetical protein
MHAPASRPRIPLRARLAIPALTLPLLLGACPGNGPSPIPATPEAPLSAPAEPAPTSIQAQQVISVPQGRPPTLDGTLSPGEWSDAVVESFSDGSELFLMHSEGYLYLAIRAGAPEMIGANIFVDRGGDVAILHTSAALGTAIYEATDAGWERTQDFVWQCRRTDASDAARAEREAFLGEEHWVAANSRMGTPNELEYQIDMADETLRLAAVFLRTSASAVKISWPVDLADDCILPTPGDLPERMDFDLDTWATIVLFQPDS